MGQSGAGLLQGKVAIVSGAGRGIGRAVALLFAAHGCKLVVNDLGCEPDGSGASETAANAVVSEIIAAGGEAVASCETVTSKAAADRMVDLAVERFERLDILVSNAGIIRDGPLLQMSETEWDEVIAVHLKGTFLCMQAAARQLTAQGQGGRIVNTVCTSGLRGSAGQCNLAAAKAGVLGLTRAAAIELQRHDITVNALAPHAKTRLTQELPAMEGHDGLSAEQVAPAALFLASSLCEAHTGCVLAAGGGRMYSYRLIETRGRHREGEPWAAEEIAEHWAAIVK